MESQLIRAQVFLYLHAMRSFPLKAQIMPSKKALNNFCKWVDLTFKSYHIPQTIIIYVFGCQLLMSITLSITYAQFWTSFKVFKKITLTLYL